QVEIAFRVGHKIFDCAWNVTFSDHNSCRHSAYRMRRYELEALVGVGSRVAPLVFGDDAQAKRLTDNRKRRQDRLPAHSRPRYEIESRLYRQFAELVGRERVNRGP